MDPDIVFLLGVLVLGLSLPLTLAAYTTSGRSFRPVIVCLLIGGGMVFAAILQSPDGYSASDVPRIIVELLG